MKRDSERESNALISAAMMLLAMIAIVGIVLGYKHCQAVDERIDACLKLGTHSAAECRAAYAIEGAR